MKKTAYYFISYFFPDDFRTGTLQYELAYFDNVYALMSEGSVKTRFLAATSSTLRMSFSVCTDIQPVNYRP